MSVLTLISDLCPRSACTSKAGSSPSCIPRWAAGMAAAAVLWPGLLYPHNLDQRDTFLAFDEATVQMMSSRAALGQPLLQGDDEIGLILKSTPYPGTATGAGGYLTFYVPVGTQVLKVDYMAPNPAGVLVPVPIKGEAINPIGCGPNGQKITSELIGLNLGPNILGVTEAAVTATGAHRGTIAGVYADTGIFYSTDPRTTFRSWEASGGYDGNPATNDNIINNNSGDFIVPITLWDAEQLVAYGMKSPGIAVVDAGDQRGNAPWGLASGVSGPQSGYAWEFRRSTWLDTATYPNASVRMKAAVDNVGPWQRIKYPGSQISQDQAGLISSVNGYAARDASTLGVEVSPSSPLPPTVSESDATSPKAVRISFGELEFGRAEYGRVTLKILGNPGDPGSPFDANGRFKMYTDAFGGDAGGEQGGKDHLWRYYYPTTASIDTGAALTKDASKDILAPGESFQYVIRAINAASTPLTNVVVTDSLPSGISYLSASPAPISTAPLTWNLGTIPGNSLVTITVNVQATGSGTIFNTANLTSTQLTASATDSVFVGLRSLLSPTKTVTPSAVAPGGTVIYTLELANTGSGANGTPLVITELLPPGFSYTGMVSQQINGGLLPAASLAINNANPNRPVFSISQSINPASKLVLRFTCAVSGTQPTGTYDNKISYTFEKKTLASGPMAPVTVGGARIGDSVFRDWDGDGIQAAEEEGIPGVTVQLHESDGSTLITSTTTTSTGAYLFTGLAAGSYVVKIGAGVPAGYTLTADPVGGLDGEAAVTLAVSEAQLDVDFGYRPGGAASIGDTVFSDLNNNGVFGGGDVGIPDVAATLYEDTNGNGVVDAGQDAVAGATTTNASGVYTFSGLAAGLSYVVVVNPADADLTSFFSPSSFTATTATAIPVPNLAASFVNADFGFFGLEPASIGDQVFLDSNGNGAYDNGDAPLSNVTVNLYAGSELLATKITASEGTYRFDGLPPGGYQVVVDATSPGVPIGYTAATRQKDVMLAAGDEVLTADFPFVALITKSVDKPYAPTGDTVTYSLRPGYPGTELLESLRVIDPLPVGTTYVSSSANAGGTYGPYTAVSAIPGNDPGEGSDPALDTSFTISSNFVTVGSSVTVTMNVKSSSARSNVSPGPLNVSGGAYTIISGPTPASANVPNGGAGTNFVWTVQLDSIGEFIFSGDAEDGAQTTSWPTASSASVLAATNGGPTAVTWTLGSNMPAVGGETVVSGYTSGVFAFRGATTNSLRKFVTGTGAWTTLANAPATIAAGGAVTTNGTGTVFALRGSGTQTFYGYNISADAWSALANTGANVNDGGSLVFLNAGGTDYVFGLMGGSTGFRRYNVSTNTWTAMANAPNSVGAGGALTTDGTYIYAFRGGNQRTFWRYDPTWNTWAALTNAPGKVKAGGALVRIGGFIYAFRGGATSSLWRYSISSNTWSSVAAAPGAVGAGGSLTTDGFLVYAFQGGSGNYWRYNPFTNTWTTLAGFGSATGAGAALVYAPGVAPAGRFTNLSATPSVVSTGDTVTIALTVESESALSDVAPSALTVTPTGGASASLVSGPTPASQPISEDGTITYLWEYEVTAGANPGSLIFSGDATGTGGVVFPSAISNSVLVSPLLTFQATVNSPAPAGGQILNTAIMADNGQEIGSFPSNTTQTATSASIGDRVWVDLDGNGAQNPGEFGLADAGVRLYAADGVTLIATATTDASGIYRFYGLTAGDYVVGVNSATFPPGFGPTTAVAVNVTVGAGEQIDDADFGVEPPGSGSIGDRAWFDVNSDGVQDVGENGIANIPVTLEKRIAGIWGVVGATTTDADGAYTFGTLTAGSYRVALDPNSVVASPHSASFTGSLGAATAPTYDLDGTASPHVAEVTLATDSTVASNVDFGYNWAGRIGDLLWYDTNGNGITDETDFAGGPRPVPNATVVLIVDVNGDGHYDDGDEIIRTYVTSDGSAEYPLQPGQTAGGYIFEDLPPGDYIVKISEQEVPSPVSGNIGTMMPTTGEKIGVVLGTGGGEAMENLTADFGFVEAPLLEGAVFHDINQNGVPDPGEPGLPNVAVTLTGADSFGDPVLITTATDADGEYTFLPPAGFYTITYNTADPQIPASLTTITTPISISLAATAGEEIGGLDFGRDDAGIVGDVVWADLNGNGTRDAEEPGLSGLTIVLYASDGATFLASAVTDAGGGYEFKGLADGTYVVEVLTAALPSGYDPTPTGDPDAVYDSRSTATITGGGSDLVHDFGYQPTATLHTVSGTVFHDQNSDSGPNLPAEALAGVTVVAAVDTDNDTVPDQTFSTATDSNGFFQFTAIAEGGDVVVTVSTGTLPNSAFVQTVDPDGTLNNSTTEAGVSGDISAINFGYEEQLGSIAGTVAEGDGNGIADAGETPISGVTISLLHAGGDGILGNGDDQTFTTTTNASGDYSFTGLLPGAYQITQTNLTGYASLADADGFNPDVISLSLAAGEDKSNQDFEDAATRVTGHLYVDTNGNGIQDAGEPDLVDVDVVITQADSGTQTVTTDGSGDWVAIVPAGNTTANVDETDPQFIALVLSGYVQTEGVDPTTVTALAGQTVDGGVDGYFNPGSISGTVLADTDNDDTGDVPLAGVTITLKDSNGDDIDSDTGTPGVQPTTTLTAVNGTYSFSDLPLGDYLVVQTQPVGYLTVTDTDGGIDNTVAVTVVTGGPAIADFIEEEPAVVGNLVWHDANNDGFKDAGEDGVDGVFIELLDATGNPVDSDVVTPGVQPTTGTTAGGGLYSFADVPPGSYRVRIAAPPAAYPLSSTTTSTADDQQDDDDNGIQATPSAATISPVIALAAGEVDNTVDFGFTGIAGTLSISGQVRDDYDLDGNFSDNDQPVSGVTVRLYADSNGNGIFDAGIDALLESTTTNGLGFYTFTGLPDGVYFVQEVDPAGATSTADIHDANDNLIIVILAGSSSMGNDFLDAVDPSGYAYDVVTGQIIAGGSIAVSGPGAVTILFDGSTGQYGFIVDGTPGSYTITYTPPSAYIIDPTRPVAGSSFDPTGGPDPTSLGAGENPVNSGYLTDATAGNNPYYLTFDLAPGDPLVLNNNIPLRLKTPRRYVYWRDVTPGGGPDPGSNSDGDCYADIIEYALNLNPGSGVQTAPVFRGVRNAITGNLDASFDRAAGGLDDVTYTLMGLQELNASPAGWAALSLVPDIIDNGDGTETVTFADLESDPYFAGASQGFVRLKVDLDVDGDTVPDLTANTPSFGWTRRTFGTECVMTGHPYLKDKNFCGTVDAVAGSVLDVTTSAGAESIVGQFVAGRGYFIEVFSGTHAGHRFEIDEASSTATAIALDAASGFNTLSSIPASLAGGTVVIREHFTLNDLFPSTQFSPTNNVSTADRVMLFNRTGGQFQIYWLFSNGGAPQWVLSGDATLADQSSLIMQPTEGWFTHPKGAAQEIVWHGMVRANPFACPLGSGPNFIGSGYPMEQSPTMRGMTGAAGFLGSNNPASADQLLFWKGYTATQAMAYFNHFLLNYGALQQWTEVGGATLINENNLPMFKPTTGSIYKMRNGLPGYVMPMPWTP